MINSAAIVSVSLWFTTVAARSRGGSSIGSISDNWDAPPIVKATLAFYVILFIVCLAQLSLLIKNLKAIPTMAARAPYIMITVLTAMLTLAYIAWTAYERLSTDGTYSTLIGLGAWGNYFLDTDIALRPAVLLFIAQQRARLLRNSQGKGVAPLASQFWKRCLDWALCAFSFLFLIANVSISVDEQRRLDAGNYDTATLLKYNDVINGFGHLNTAFLCLLAIDVFVTYLTLHLSEKRYRFADPVTFRLLVTAVPLMIAFALEWFIIEIVAGVGPKNGLNIDYDALVLSEVIIEGIIRVGITAALISTMTMPNVQWTGVAPGYTGPANYPPSYHTGTAGWHSNSPPIPGQNPPQQPPQQPQQPPAQPYTIPMSVSQT